MTENTEPIEDRDANVRLTVSRIIFSKQDEMFERFDGLKKRGITDTDLVEALRHLGEAELLDAYAEWADIDLREDDNTTLNPAVPDPGESFSYAPLEQAIAAGGGLSYTKADVEAAAEEIREDADLTGKWSNGLAEIELTNLHVDRNLIGAVWNAVQPDGVFGARHLVITPAGLRDAGYKRVQA